MKKNLRRPERDLVPKGWHQPYEVLVFYLTARSPETRASLLRHVPGLCRKLRARTFYLRVAPGARPKDPNLIPEIWALKGLAEDPTRGLDEDSRERIVKTCEQILGWRPRREMGRGP